MKLYTEEQVKDLNYWKNNAEDDYLTTPISVLRYISQLEKLTPIELPSDEELEEWIINCNYEFSRVDIQTTKWVIEQIKQQDDTRG